jgi:pimeloyl-ACP methyl ester carboxylesterase
MRTSSRRHGWTFRILAALAVAFLIAAVAGFTYEQIGRSRDREGRFRIGRAVDIGGRILNIDCAGDGAPAVILEPGGGGYGGYNWRKVQPEVAKFTRVCWYDRAGEGWSDPPPTTRNSAMVSHDLHELLLRAPVPGPYVLVGHSIGGSYVRIYAAQFPADVVGMVLVDSSHPDQHEPAVMLSPLNRLPGFARRLLCYAVPLAGRFGVMRFAMRNVPVFVPPQFSSQESAAARVMRGQRVKAFETEAEQGCDSTQGGAIRSDRGSGDPEIDQAARNAGNLGDVPLVVLTAGQYWKPADPLTAEQVAQFHQLWVNELQPQLAGLSTHGRQIVVENSGHGIPDQAPEAVVSAIHDVVLDVRARKWE